MSDETSSNSDSDGAIDLSGLNFGPAWARDPSEAKNLKKFKDRGDRDDRRGGGGRNNDRRGGGRRDGGGQGRRGGGRRDHDRDRRPPRHEVEPPAGVTLKLMPAEESLDLLAKRVVDSGQTYSVFDLAKVLLQSRDRFRVTFESSDKPFFRCREDQSIWVSRDEALRHLWRGEWLKKYYEEVQVEGEAPKGSFSSVARCGISNELLGPPNYHGYQEKLAALHRERFSNMPFEAYRAKVRVGHGEEAVEAWLESMKTVTKWKVAKPQSEEKPAEEEKSEAADPSAEQGEADPETPPATEEATATQEAPASAESKDAAPAAEEESTETPVDSQSEPAAEEPSVEEAPPEEEPPPAAIEEEAPPAELFDDARAVERHFAENHFEEVFEKTERAWVMGDIRGNLLSPGLLTLLKRSVAEEKRYPAKLMPVVCRQLSGRHVAVFKWKKKLKVGPSRPHAVPTDTPLAERPRAIIDHLTVHSGVKLKEFWEAVMPEGVTAEQKHEWLQDFQWLLGEGHIILLSDTTIHLAKKPGEQQSPPAAKKSEEPHAAEPEKKAPGESPEAAGEPQATDASEIKSDEEE